MRVQPVPRARTRKANYRHSAYCGSIYGGIRALAQGYSHDVTQFNNLDGLLDGFTFVVLHIHRLKVELVRQRPLKVSGP